MNSAHLDYLSLLGRDPFSVPESAYKGTFEDLTTVLEAPGLLKHHPHQSQMEWSKKNVIAIHLNSLIYFYKENRRIEDSIDLNKYNQSFDDNHLVDMKFNSHGSKLLTVDVNNMVSSFDVGEWLSSGLIPERKKSVQNMSPKTGPISSISWTSDHSFCLTNKLGMIHFFDSRCSFKTNSTIDKIDSSLDKINISSFCLDNNKIAFGGNQSRVHLFDIRNMRRPYIRFQSSCSSPHYTS